QSHRALSEHKTLSISWSHYPSLMRFDDEMVMPPEMKFSKREREILKWTAEGKTSAEIAIILSISENTVNFHQKNMQKKFNAPNKTQIACYAAATGLI
ncbi:LuxR C-terminal-related transcriptional regulator, partial [Enterobacter roggenkampii]|uniref:LuxR C-terminal-related transcriptional regulator n=2 Tax=Enterobacter roggenkampii TaxID=1812935 RepID=UPI001F0A642F